MTDLSFIKMHGLGNDFVIVDLRGGENLPSNDAIAVITDRKVGVGCDQFIAVLPAKTSDADCYMRIFNAPDASEVEACGNATRCVADLLMTDLSVQNVVVETVAGLLRCRRENGGYVMVDMGKPRFDWSDIPLAQNLDTMALQPDAASANSLSAGVGVNVGNPHVVFFLDRDVESFDVARVGHAIEHDPLFPQKTNVEFCNMIDARTIRMRVWERDAGETQACGTGACAVALAAMRRSLVQGRECSVVLNGGTLDFVWRASDDHILMSGPATYVFEGSLKL